MLEQIASKYGCNVVTGSGELSQTACVNLVERAEESGRPVRILYISDFDPAGQSMPVAVSRKIEHRLYLKNLHSLDIQVRPIVLTLEQCQQYRLPRTPIKDTEKRITKFEDRYGEGATELDALEALHPGQLQQIIEGEIKRYYDSDLGRDVNATVREVEFNRGNNPQGPRRTQSRNQDAGVGVETDCQGPRSPDCGMAETGETCMARHRK